MMDKIQVFCENENLFTEPLTSNARPVAWRVIPSSMFAGVYKVQVRYNPSRPNNVPEIALERQFVYPLQQVLEGAVSVYKNTR